MDALRIGDWLLEPDLNQLSGPADSVHLDYLMVEELVQSLVGWLKPGQLKKVATTDRAKV